MTEMKMNTLLAKVEHSASSIQRLFNDYAVFFKTKQGAFRGVKNTFVARDGYLDDPSKMGTTRVVTTVDEKMGWFNEQFKNYLKDVFAVESTNSEGANRVELKVGDVSFGFLTALDLMRLKNILTNKDFETILTNIPVRSDSVNWVRSTDPEYEGREVFETEIIKGVTRTTEKDEVILKDPNLDPSHMPANYSPRTTIKTKTVETGDYTHQDFTGEWTQRQRAELLRRRSQLLEAVIAALKEVNDCKTCDPNLDVDTLVNFIYKG